MQGHGYRFEVIGPPFEEPGERSQVSGPAHAEALAFYKASSVAGRNPDKTVLGADTIAWIDGQIIGKPRDRADAKRILTLLSGTTHDVITGAALVHAGADRRLIEYDVTVVRVRPLSDAMIEAYLDTGLWRGKAGAYGIQDEGDPFVEAIEGSRTNVVGLPMELLSRMFATWCAELQPAS